MLGSLDSPEMMLPRGLLSRFSSDVGFCTVSDDSFVYEDLGESFVGGDF